MSRRFASGDLIGGKYRLVRQIGAGAMGAVWVAHNDLLDVDVAVKLLRPIDNRRADPNKLYHRLLQEARAAARLGHPGIVRIFDFGQADDNTPFIVMELLEGESLADVLAREPRLGVNEAIGLLLPVADALATAHDRGIVHRDVKPENIFLSKDEYGRVQPKVVDFGVARFAEGGRSMTRSGALMGTPDYMAPEQARGEPEIDHRVDIWALCIVLYELMTGRRPFASDATNYLAVLQAIVRDDVRPITDYKVGDSALWLILERGLRRNRNERWETIRVLGEALALWLYERGVREDALGGSLKTTWLQSGLAGVKIETASILPPPPDSEPYNSAPTSAATLSAPPSAPVRGSPIESGPRQSFQTDIPAEAEFNDDNLGKRSATGTPSVLPAPFETPGRRRWGLIAALLVLVTMASLAVIKVDGDVTRIPPAVAEAWRARFGANPGPANVKDEPAVRATSEPQPAARAAEGASERSSPPSEATSATVSQTATATPAAASAQEESTLAGPEVSRTKKTTTSSSSPRPARRKKSLPPAGSYDFGF